MNSFNVSPVSIENALLVHPEVDEVCVTYRDRDLGEKKLSQFVSSDSEINSIELLILLKINCFSMSYQKKL